MITKLCKEGNITEAREVFDVMLDQDVITWTALISGYINCGLIKEARELFDLRVDAMKNVVTWTVMISGYLKLTKRSCYEAESLFYEMPDKNVVAWNTMLDGYIRGDMIEKALVLFDGMEKRNVVSWNMVISGSVNCGRVEEARRLFGEMPTRDVWISWTIMISGLARNERVDEARLLFDRMPERNVNGELEIAKRLFNEMPSKNVVSWTAMISGCMRYGESEEALKMFLAMNKGRKVNPNEGTFVSVLGACSDLAGLGEGMQIHQVISKTIYQDSEFVISALINMYSKCGELVMARKMFDDGSRGKRDLVLWNSMIVAYAHHGCGREATMVFEEMQNTGFMPNDVTYVGLLSACSHAGLVHEGLNYFYALLRDKSVTVREDHYTCVVDLYGRAGRLEEAFVLIKESPLKDSKHALGALLLGCNIHGNGDIGKLVAEKLMDVEIEKAGSYVLLSNMYISSGKWKEAEMVKVKMMDGGLKKQPGCSWIEVGNKFHVFVVGDKSHRESDAIHCLLFDLHKKMKKIGYALLDNFMMEEDFLLI
ncbi:hypothetical protein BUALT_BualtUnG0031800 [Buddleja alternifolia]|uniref:Chlororespiratory reduction 4 n=1 Tax=Buddleja alternifolia TaxID=168488 RepID=A0AAV6W3C5_9LAMI|nr:hypothetical protein BUALT_BualtUnG0031800 [Buddleja alternifolia]